MFSGKRTLDSYSRVLALLYLIALCFVCITCSDGDSEPDPVPPLKDEFVNPLEGLPDEGPINFQNPSIGQRSRFVLFEAEYKRPAGDVVFNYLTDTLVIAITGKKSEDWIIKEFLTEGSASRLPIEDTYWGFMADSVFLSYLHLDADSIYFYRAPQQWFITFAFHQDQKFPLSLVSDDFPENPNGLPLFGSSGIRWMEFTKDFVRPGKSFDRLNMYFNYIEMRGDGHGYTYLYSPSDGLVRIAWISAWHLDDAAGWDWVP